MSGSTSPGSSERTVTASAPDALAIARQALAARDWVRADAAAGALLAQAQVPAEAWFIAGIAALELRRPGAAIQRLQRAAESAPGDCTALAQLARALAMVDRMPQALAAADAAMALQPADALTLDTLGVVYSRGNAHARAAAAFRRAASLLPARAAFRFNLAAALTFTGELAEAEAEYEACIALDPRCWRAHSALAQLRRWNADTHHIDRLQALLPQAQGDADATLHLRHALAKECEDLGEHAAAFAHLVAGKRAKRATLGYDFSHDAALFDAIEALFPADLTARPGHATTEPIFVIGLPRTGTTLVERILTSHPDVASAGELQNFGQTLKHLSGSRTPALLDRDTLQRATAIDPRALGERYLASTRPITGSTPRFVDKMPLNFLMAGWIAAALPQARLVCLHREALDACLGNFRQLFATGWSYYNYAYDLLDTGRYWLRFERLMRYWDERVPGRILTVNYEALVADQEAQTRRLLDFCGLPWDPACLAFERNAAPVATASAVQVRQPMYAGAVGRWRRYEAELAPLRRLLEEAT